MRAQRLDSRRRLVLAVCAAALAVPAVAGPADAGGGLGTPSGLTASAVSTSQIRLAWNAASGAFGYDVLRSSASGGPYTLVATTKSVLSYTDSGLGSGQTYYYVVEATKNKQVSGPSNEAAGTTLPDPPTGVHASSVSSSQINIEWNASTGATSYRVLRAGASGGPYALIGTVGAGTPGTAVGYADTGLPPSTTYYYVVQAVDAGGASANSTEATATTATPVAPTVTLTSSANPSVEGQPVTFTATVSAPSSGPTPTGSVTFFDGSTALGSGTLGPNPQASLTTSALAFGSHSITAAYSGDGNYQPSTSTAVDQQVLHPTSTALTASPDPADSGQAVTFVATVTSPAGTPSGTVDFYDGTALLGSAPLDGTGTASYTTSALTTGTHSVTAGYLGAKGDYASSTSAPVSETVNPPAGATSTTLSSSPNPSRVGEQVTLTATVTGNGTPTGAVAFLDGDSVLGSATLDASGVATLTVTFPSAGAHSLTAQYGGDETFAPSTSPVDTQQVQTVAFAPYVAYPTGSWPTSTAIADVTGDGRNDVLMTTGYYFSNNDFKLFVFTQQADGSLGAPTMLGTDGKYGDSMRLATGDLNGDGHTDVVLTTSAGLDLYFQQNSGLSAPTLMATPSSVTDVVVADVNSDGINDLVVDTQAGVLLYPGLGAGAFAPPTTVTTTAQTEVQVGDVNGDSAVDVVGFTGTTVHVFAQTATGAFAPGVDYPVDTGGFSLGSMALGDVTGDGRDDVLVSIDANRPDSAVVVLPQQPDGSLGSPTSFASLDCPEPLVVADVDGDGHPDVVTAHGGWNAVGVWLQEQGALADETTAPIPYASHYDIRGLSVGDVNGDGRPDIVLADNNNGLVVLRQQ